MLEGACITLGSKHTYAILVDIDTMYIEGGRNIFSFHEGLRKKELRSTAIAKTGCCVYCYHEVIATTARAKIFSANLLICLHC